MAYSSWETFYNVCPAMCQALATTRKLRRTKGREERAMGRDRGTHHREGTIAPFHREMGTPGNDSTGVLCCLPTPLQVQVQPHVRKLTRRQSSGQHQRSQVTAER